MAYGAKNGAQIEAARGEGPTRQCPIFAMLRPGILVAAARGTCARGGGKRKRAEGGCGRKACRSTPSPRARPRHAGLSLKRKEGCLFCCVCTLLHSCRPLSCCGAQ